MLSVNRRASDVRTLIADWRSTNRKIGFVPTMGALHEGHASLIRASIEECDRTIVSVFVNPLQFERQEDLKTYPQDEKEDLNFVADLGANALFLPAVDEMYPVKPLTKVIQSGLTDHLDGAARPGFFDGILTVVLKLFNIVSPDIAYFGEKDFQQVAVVKRMVQDLSFTIEVRGLPTARESDGLAFSSRNKLLSTSAREEAPLIYRALERLRSQFISGEKQCQVLLDHLRQDLTELNDASLDYASIVDPRTVQPREGEARQGDVAAVAIFLGAVRLIDNIILDDAHGGFYR